MKPSNLSLGATSPRTTCAASAYIGGLRIECKRDGRVHDYTRRHDVVAGGVILPDGAPAGLSEPSALWNEVEKVACDGEVVWPSELTGIEGEIDQLERMVEQLS